MNEACAMIFDVKCSKQVEFKFCSSTSENATTADTLLLSIQDTLNQDDVNWSNCVSFGVDNCNMNIGVRNSIKTRISAIP